MRFIDIATTMGLVSATSLTLACKPAREATEVPSKTPTRAAAEASCRHELGRCGGHLPGDDSCGAATPATDDGPAAAPPAPNPLRKDLVLQPGEFAEINLEMDAGAASTVEFSASGGPLAWNVHSHEGERAIIHDQGNTAAGSVRFTATRTGGYSYLWKNDGASPVKLEVSLGTTGSVKVHSVHQPPSD